MGLQGKGILGGAIGWDHEVSFWRIIDSMPFSRRGAAREVEVG